MKNIDYLKEFFKKHSLSGKITVKYTSKVENDNYMSNITFEDGTVININDVIFDIISDFPKDIAEQWLETKKTEDISLLDWIKSGGYKLKNLDTSSIEEYQNEVNTIMEELKKDISTLFELQPDDGDSDEDDEDDED